MEYYILLPNNEVIIRSANKMQGILDDALSVVLGQRVNSVIVLEKHHESVLMINVPHLDMAIFYDPLDCSEKLAILCNKAAQDNPRIPMFYINHNGNGWSDRISSSNVMSFQVENEKDTAKKIVAEYPNLLVKCTFPTEEVLASTPPA